MKKSRLVNKFSLSLTQDIDNSVENMNAAIKVNVGNLSVQRRIQGEGAGGAHPPPPGDMYSQQFTLCYFLVKSPLIRIRF